MAATAIETMFLAIKKEWLWLTMGTQRKGYAQFESFVFFSHGSRVKVKLICSCISQRRLFWMQMQRIKRMRMSCIYPWTETIQPWRLHPHRTRIDSTWLCNVLNVLVSHIPYDASTNTFKWITIFGVKVSITKSLRFGRKIIKSPTIVWIFHR